MCINIFWTPFPKSASLELQTDLARSPETWWTLWPMRAFRRLRDSEQRTQMTQILSMAPENNVAAENTAIHV